jgi:hypothetical protein
MYFCQTRKSNKETHCNRMSRRARLESSSRDGRSSHEGSNGEGRKVSKDHFEKLIEASRGLKGL